jgi:glutathione S-transferase
MSAPLRVFTFSPAFGLPTAGPFGLKLVACLSMLGVPFELVAEDDARKGPKRKSPWIEHGGVRLGDTELILQYVERTFGVALDAGLAAPERARGHALRRMIEEHLHQVFEYELFLDPRGWTEVGRPMMRRMMPAPVAAVVGPLFRRQLRRHLYERGVARHGAAEIEAFGRADVDALAAALGDQPWLLGDAPTKVDASAFGMLACLVETGLPTPVARHAQATPALVAYVARGRARFSVPA